MAVRVPPVALAGLAALLQAGAPGRTPTPGSGLAAGALVIDCSTIAPASAQKVAAAARARRPVRAGKRPDRRRCDFGAGSGPPPRRFPGEDGGAAAGGSRW